jgi:hypothetical protein
MVFGFILLLSLIFTGCSSLGSDTVKNSTSPAAENNTEVNGPPQEAATYRYINPTAIVSVTKTDGSAANKWKEFNSDKDSAKIKQIADLVNSGIARRQATNAEIKAVKNGLLTGLSLEFNDKSKVSVCCVYKSARKGNLGKPSKDLYLFEVRSGNNNTFFTISSKSMVNYLLKNMDKDFPKMK